MAAKLERIKLSGFKSIREMDLPLTNLNILIGPNGAGKTNFISFFEFFRASLIGDIRYYVTKHGGASAVLYNGSKRTKQLRWEMEIEGNDRKVSYQSVYESNVEDKLFLAEVKVMDRDGANAEDATLLVGDRELADIERDANPDDLGVLIPILENIVFVLGKNCRVYQFHDTSAEANIRLSGDIEDNLYLQPDGRNLAAYLFMLKNSHPNVYTRVVSAIQQIAPFFGEFVLVPPDANPNTIRLRWREKGSDQIFGAHQLSDGTIRTMALITMLHQPKMPDLVLIDEPELGLHPYALSILASLIKSASKNTQIILSTQSVSLVNHFDIEDLIVVERKDGQSVFERKAKEEFKDWLTEYSVGQLWEMNVLGGRPS